ncbi:MAG: DUF423 domain-containing protein [Leptospirales bacterium]
MTLSVMGAIMCALAVIIDAGASHLVVDASEQVKGWLKTGVQYQFIHGIALIITRIYIKISNKKNIQNLLMLSGGFFLAGIIFFCGGLYSLALWGVRPIPMMTPVGGLCFIVGWGLLAYTFYRDKNQI